MSRTIALSVLVLSATIVAGSAALTAGDAAPPVTADDLAELPLWPHALLWPLNEPPKVAPPKAGQPPAKPKAGLLVWVPPKATRIRAMLIIPNNSDSKSFGEHPLTREIAEQQEMGIIYLRAGDFGEIQAILDAIAEKTKVEEFRHAPWIPFGKSSRGGFPHELAWRYPKRTIAGINYHGAVPTYPPPEHAQLHGESILWVNANGENEWGGTWYLHVRPSFLNYRAKAGWLPHVVVVRGVGHGDYVDGHGSDGWGKPIPPGKVSCTEVWSYLAKYCSKAISLRVPAGKYATTGPVDLLQVDESKGILVDPYAVEALFDVPRLPLTEKDGTYLVHSGTEANESPVSGFASFAPLKDFAPPADVPVTTYEPGRSPTKWLITDSLKFAMQADPMVDLGDLAKLMPKPGDEITVDGSKLTFQPIPEKYVSQKNGGIALKTGLRPGRFDAKITLFAYTVLEFPEKKLIKVNAGYTAASRIQLVLNGIPVRNKQILEMQPGRYPLLFALRLSANWDRVEPGFTDAKEEEVAQAKQQEADYLAAVEAQAKLKATGLLSPANMLRDYASVPAEQRKKMLWIADRELADAWIRLHSIGSKAAPAK